MSAAKKETYEAKEARIEIWLKQQNKAELVTLILDRFNEDGDFFEAMLLKATVAQPFENLRDIKKVIQQAYKTATKYVQKAKALATKCGALETFDSQLVTLRNKNNKKRNFMKFLTEAGL